MAPAVRILIIGILLGLLLICLGLFWPRFLYQEGVKQLQLKNYDKAVYYLDRAEKKVPKFLAETYARADMYRIYTHYGRALYHKGIQDWKDNGPSIKTYTLLRKAKINLSKADAVSPITYRNSYWLTLTEEALEKLHGGLFPKLKNPYDADAFYRKTLSLRPAGSSIRYAYVRYLDFKDRRDEIPAVMENLLAIYPPAYYPLRKEPFYSKDLSVHAAAGLKKALENDVMPGEAAKALSNLYEQRQELSQAVSYYRAYLGQQPSGNSPYDYIHLGRLFLKQGEEDQGLEAFERSIGLADNIPGVLNRLYRTLKAENRQEQFFPFLSRLSEKGIPLTGADMTLARIHVDMKQYDQARQILNRMTAAKPDPAAHALLAEIARRLKDWDQMELSAQQAVRLDPDNARYYYTLARSLYYQKKVERAEEEISSAIDFALKENPWYYRFRAGIRWARGKTALAVSDWEKAFELKPDRSDFAYRIALGCEKLAEFDKALTYIGKALSLAPDNKKYLALHKRLESYKR